MMPDPKQLRILKALTVLLEGITTANGYDMDLANKVFRGKTVFGADEQPPFLTILEGVNPDPRPDEAGYDRLHRLDDWPLLIQGYYTVPSDHPTDDLYRLKAAVEQRLSLIMSVDANGIPMDVVAYRLGGLVVSARIGPGIVRAAMPQSGGTEAFYLPVAVRYDTNMADPWA